MNDGRSLPIKQIKEANDIVSVVGQYLSLRQVGKSWKGLCPFHNDSRPSMDIDPKFQNYHCWSCGAKGDVIAFVEKYEKVNFLEAVEQLARRAGISLDRSRNPEDTGKLMLLDALKWAHGLYQHVYLEDPVAEAARKYIGDRKLLGETVRKFGLGFAPLSGDFIAKQIEQAPVPVDVLVSAGLIAKSDYGSGYYDRFRDRVMFPIRDLKGHTVGFGGRILPSSPYAERGPKYYNTADSIAFKKSELVYGLDAAKLAAQAAGYLAVVEGYTDVLMAHQCGVTNVVATMGTALTADHVRTLRRFASRVVLVYDADAGGTTGVDRALELFIREDVDLAIATLPDGLDPFDLLVGQGAEPFKKALASAADVLDYKIERVFAEEAGSGIEAGRRAVEAVLAVIALAPDTATTATKVRRELIVNRVAHRFGLNDKTLWARLDELRKRRPREDGPSTPRPADEVALTGSSGKAEPIERELVEVLLAEPVLVAKAKAELPSDAIRHPGLNRIVSELYNLLGNGVLPDLDALRMRLIDKPKLAEFAQLAYEIGSKHKERPAWLGRVLDGFRNRDATKTADDLKSKLKAAGDPKQAMELLRKLQENTAGK